MEFYDTPLEGQYFFFLYRLMLLSYCLNGPFCAPDVGGRQSKSSLNYVLLHLPLSCLILSSYTTTKDLPIMVATYRPRWLSGLSRHSNSSRVAAEYPG